jgi:CheY-like chemotaxis protein
MAEPSIQALKSRRLLVVEDDYLLADDLARFLEELGAYVVGPVGSIDDALALIASENDLDGALLDINLHGQHVFPVADALAAREVPFIFTTGYDRVAIPEAYADVPLCSKPTDALRLAQSLAAELTR